MAEAVARLPPAPLRRQNARRQHPIGLAVEPIHVFPASPTVRERAEGVGRRLRQRVAQLTRAMRRWDKDDKSESRAETVEVLFMMLRLYLTKNMNICVF